MPQIIANKKERARPNGERTIRGKLAKRNVKNISKENLKFWSTTEPIEFETAPKFLYGKGIVKREKEPDAVQFQLLT